MKPDVIGLSMNITLKYTLLINLTDKYSLLSLTKYECSKYLDFLEGGGIEGILLTRGAVRKKFEKHCFRPYSLMSVVSPLIIVSIRNSTLYSLTESANIVMGRIEKGEFGNIFFKSSFHRLK